MTLDKKLIVPTTYEDLTAGFRAASLLLREVRADLAWQTGLFGRVVNPKSIFDERDLLRYLAESPMYTPERYGL